MRRILALPLIIGLCGPAFADSFTPGAATPPTKQCFTASGSYPTPAGAVWLGIKGAGGGAGGAGTGSSPGAPGAGGTTSFVTGGGTTLISATGGNGNTPGSATINSPAVGDSIIGGTPNTGQFTGSTAVYLSGGMGGATIFGGAGGGGLNGTGLAASANTGAGGGGAGTGGSATNTTGGTGGASGGAFDAVIPNPSGTYTVTIGTGGAGGTAGTGGNGFAGGNGAAGKLCVEAHFGP